LKREELEESKNEYSQGEETIADRAQTQRSPNHLQIQSSVLIKEFSDFFLVLASFLLSLLLLN
jgi:hypothetical protein